MTAIAWHGPSKTLAADKMMTIGSYPATVTKIARTFDGSLMGGEGTSDLVTELMHWYRNGASPQDFPSLARSDEKVARLLVIKPGGIVHLYYRSPYPIEIQDQFFALGCGGDFALAAMHLGKNAVEAVELAIKLDNHCGNGVDVLQLDT